MHELSAELIADYYPFTDFRTAHEVGVAALAAGEAIASLHRPVARLALDPDITAAATHEMRQLDGAEIFVDMFDNEQLQADTAFPFRSTPALRHLIHEGDRVFRDIVRAEVSDAAGSIRTMVTAGPYEPHQPDMHWHRDFGPLVPGLDLKAVTYNVELIGQTITASTGVYFGHDFDGANLRAARAPRPGQQHNYASGTIVALDGSFGVYRTPGEDYRGQPWLNIRSFVVSALASNQNT